METILLDANGLRTEAVLLAVGNGRMRVVLRNGSDTIELRREDEQWISEDGDTFTFEAWIASGRPGVETSYDAPWRRVDRAFGAWLQQVNLGTGSANLLA